MGAALRPLSPIHSFTAVLACLAPRPRERLTMSRQQRRLQDPADMALVDHPGFGRARSLSCIRRSSSSRCHHHAISLRLRTRYEVAALRRDALADTAMPEPRQHPQISEEVLPLPLPLDRERLQELGEPCRRPPVEDPLDDVGGEEREPQHAADVGAADPFGVGQLGERAEPALLQQPAPAVRPRQRLDERAVDLRRWRPVVSSRVAPR